MIAVTATDENDGSWGPEDEDIEIAAPGHLIRSTACYTCDWPDTALYYYTHPDTATSWATPHVAGAAAMIKSYYTNWTNEDVRERLQETAIDLGTPGRDDQYGYGLLDIAAAVGISPLSVSISGPTVIQPEDDNCTWTAVVSGGASPYTYSWRYDGVWVSSASSWTGGLDSGDTDDEFYLTLWVTDLGSEAESDEILVTTSEQARWCPSK